MICTNFDGYMTQLCHHELMISWKITLTDNTIVYGDYDRPGHDNAWQRLKIHCEENDVLPKRLNYICSVPSIKSSLKMKMA